MKLIISLVLIKCWLPIQILATSNFISGSPEQCKIVPTEYGTIRGQLEMSIIDQKPFHAYRGIPYARAPIGDLRFKAPQPPLAWTGIRDTLEFGNECIQKSFISKMVVGNEDCLFLNVYVPATPLTEKPPVMVFIHGGAFYFGSGNGFGADLLVSRDVILVTINYRLGPYGFLSLGTADYSGNMGMKDQSAAIRWVQRNIEYFGGDSNRITVFGESAGSSSVQYQVLSPMNRGLFHRAIMQSGSALSPFAFHVKSDHIEEIRALARKFGSDPRNIDELLQFLNRVEPRLLILESIRDLYYPGDAAHETDSIWIPIIEVPNAKDPFLQKTPRQYLAERDENNLDLLLGFNTAEMYFATLPELVNPELLEPFDQKFELQLPKKEWIYDYNSSEYRQITNEIRRFYLPNGGRVNKDSYIQFNQILSDAWFVVPIDESANSHAWRSYGKVFYYVFSMDTALNKFKTMFDQVNFNLPGTSHLDELLYLFYFSFEGITFEDTYRFLTDDSPELRGIKTMTTLWTNFAKYGHPTPHGDPIDWPPVLDRWLNYVEITNEGLIKGTNPYKEKIQFWRDLYVKYDHAFTKLFKVYKDEL